ncbi:MAG TPA: hypothetical protein VHX65_05490 [Pirellulales bacterium]|jgi:hypothetical protein|nr:hypothetical protein [Pirellulales bacterium]
MRRSLVLCGCPELLRQAGLRAELRMRQAVVLCSPELLCEAGLRAELRLCEG